MASPPRYRVKEEPVSPPLRRAKADAASRVQPRRPNRCIAVTTASTNRLIVAPRLARKGHEGGAFGDRKAVRAPPPLPRGCGGRGSSSSWSIVSDKERVAREAARWEHLSGAPLGIHQVRRGVVLGPSGPRSRGGLGPRPVADHRGDVRAAATPPRR